MYDWFPIVFVTFKVLVLVTGMFFAIKWHYDQGKTQMDKRALLLTVGKVGAVFLLLLGGLVYVTFAVIRMLGM